MSIHRRRRRLERRLALAGGWRPETTAGSERALFDRSFELAEAARDLERVAGADGSAGATAASLACATSALGSLANSMLKMRGLVVRRVAADQEVDVGDAEQLGRLLYAISQNLRFAAEAADLGRQAADDGEIAAAPRVSDGSP